VRGNAYAAAWLPVRVTVRQSVDPKTGQIVRYDPPRVNDQTALAVLRDDGAAFADLPRALAGVAPLARLALEVRLPAQPPADRCWSGAGVKRFLAGERPGPADVFWRAAAVVDRFMDFNHSLAGQEVMCELIACYTLGTYFLDAFNVVGYLWPSGDKGAGKTNLLAVVAEMAYLGQVILAGGSYASLRDLADYGATLAFDDAEGVMDLRRADPDKRALLLAGNRRGATVTIKEPAGERGWVTRHIDAFCPRLFSAIRLPDETLGSRTLVIPLVRSADQVRAKDSPLDHEAWPCDRRQLVDDLWCLGLTHLKQLKAFDKKAAARARLAGRDLEPWRSVLAVALWLQERHGVADVHQRMTDLAKAYQTERSDFGVSDQTRLVIRALGELLATRRPASTGVRVEFKTADLTNEVNRLAEEDDLGTPEKPFTNRGRVGWSLRRLRLSRPDGKAADRRGWLVSLADVEGLAAAYGIQVEGPKAGAATDEDVETF
jgi:hypothetical protein